MRLIENINSILRFFGYLLPLFILIAGRGFLWKVYNYLNWHQEQVFTIVYNIAVVLAILFALIAFIKVYKFGSKRKRNQCVANLTKETRRRIAHLAEVDNSVELFFAENHDWLEKDLEAMIDEYSKKNIGSDFISFKQFVNENATVYFSHRVTKRIEFLNIINRM